MEELKDSLLVTESLFDRLPENDPHVFDCVVVIDVTIAAGLDSKPDGPMPSQVVEHVIEEADAGIVGIVAAVETQIDGDIGLLGLAFDAGGAGGHFSVAD